MRRLRPLAVTGALALALALGFGARDVLSSDGEAQSLRKVQEAYQIVSRNYVDRVDTSELAEDAILGMIEGLDPHSIYITAEEMRAVRESFEASFDGIGIFYELVEGAEDRDTVVVLQALPGGPSEEVGLMGGDRIVQIDDTTAIGFTQDLVQQYLKGPRGTRVRVVVERPGFDGRLSFDITRDQIPLNTVAASYMVDEQTGYVKLTRFARTSADEVRDAIAALRADGMDRLVLDLRDNAGGLLDQAYEIADELLPAGDMVVFTDSRHPNNRRRFVATAGGAYEDGPLIVLLNENSASASEIVAGAVQDHDRGLLVGRRSFGKGLVQQQFQLSDGSVLQMTVSRYYTPAGRLIQTPYERGDSGEDYIAAKVELRDAEREIASAGGLVDADRLARGLPDSLLFETDGGRTVYGGGGILPDYIVTRDTLSPALQVVIGRGLDNAYARHLIDTRPGIRERYADPRAFARQAPGLVDVDDFLSFAAGRPGIAVADARPAGADSSAAVLLRPQAAESAPDIQARVGAFLARRLFGVEAFYPVVDDIDRTLQQALRLWDTAEALAAR